LYKLRQIKMQNNESLSEHSRSISYPSFFIPNENSQKSRFKFFSNGESVTRYYAKFRMGFTERARSTWTHLSLSLSPPPLSLWYMSFSGCCVKIFILPPMENYDPKEILPRRPIFILRDIGIFYHHLLTSIWIEWTLCESPPEYFSREVAGLRRRNHSAFLFSETPRKCIVFKSAHKFNFFAKKMNL
jgi:hypothetical protein